MNEHPTVSQNRAHRNDIAWIKTKGKSFETNGKSYISEYLNPWTGQAIRQTWEYINHRWFIFDAAGKVIGSAHSLTQAKYEAAKP
jgi:hypothetical protein